MIITDFEEAVAAFGCTTDDLEEPLASLDEAYFRIGYVHEGDGESSLEILLKIGLPCPLLFMFRGYDGSNQAFYINTPLECAVMYRCLAEIGFVTLEETPKPYHFLYSASLIGTANPEDVVEASDSADADEVVEATSEFSEALSHCYGALISAACKLEDGFELEEYVRPFVKKQLERGGRLDRSNEPFIPGDSPAEQDFNDISSSVSSSPS